MLPCALYLEVNVAGAVTVAQVAIAVVRQQLGSGQLVHGMVTKRRAGDQCHPRARDVAISDAGGLIGFAS